MMNCAQPHPSVARSAGLRYVSDTRPAASELDIDGRKVRVNSPHKVLYPGWGFTKEQVIDYYARIAEVLLPHLQKCPVTLKRYPDGVEAKFFCEKNAPAHRQS